MFPTRVNLLGLAVIWIPLVAATDYCTEVKCGTKHTMCAYPDETPGDKCLSLSGQGVDAEQIKDLLHIHNTWRDYVAAGKETRTLGGPLPQAANMGVMTWDEEMARVAQRWALQCHFGHDECRALPHMSSGQNLALSGNTNRIPLNMTKLAFMWYKNEVGLYDTQGDTVFHFTKKTGHFTQWIWARSYKLGCGYSGYKNDNMHMNYLVCNYGPAGNVGDSYLYLDGRPCSACPNGTTCGGDRRYPNLCNSDSGEVPVFGKEEIMRKSGSASRPITLPLGLWIVLTVSIAHYILS